MFIALLYLTMLEFYVIICILFGMSEAVNNDLKISEDKHRWIDAKQICNGRMAGQDLFNNCQPDTCKPENITKLEALNLNEMVWINGYVERSPLLKEYGCLEIAKSNKAITIDSLAKTTMMQKNGVFDCSRFCKGDNEVILLRMNVCYCVPYTSFLVWERMSVGFNSVPSTLCNHTCAGDSGYYFCGSNDENRIIVSSYAVSDHGVIDRPRNIGQICFYFSAGTNLRPFYESSCKEKKSYICQRKRDGEECVNLSFSPEDWYEARRTCQRFGEYFQLASRVDLCRSTNVSTATDGTWDSIFIIERIIWNSETIPENENRSCLAFRKINETEYEFLKENCLTFHSVLCENGDVQNTTAMLEKPDYFLWLTIPVVSLISTIFCSCIIYISIRKIRKRKQNETVAKKDRTHKPSVDEPVASAVYEAVDDNEMIDTLPLRVLRQPGHGNNDILLESNTDGIVGQNQYSYAYTQPSSAARFEGTVVIYDDPDQITGVTCHYQSLNDSRQSSSHTYKSLDNQEMANWNTEMEIADNTSKKDKGDTVLETDEEGYLIL